MVVKCFVFTKNVLSWQTELSSLESQIREAAKRYQTFIKMNRTIIQILFFLIWQNSISQIDYESLAKPTIFDSIVQNKNYRIEFSPNQFLELIEYKNGDYSGHLVNCVWENKRKKSRSNIIAQKIKIPNLLVKNLMVICEKKNIEIIPDCKETKNCIIGFDGTTTNIFINTSQKSRNYFYWEVESNHYYKNGNVPEEIQHIRDILFLIEKDTDYKVLYRKFLDRLPKGSYSYGGINMIKT